MNWDRVHGSWNQVEGKAKQMRGAVRTTSSNRSPGSGMNRSGGCIKYGISKDKAQEQADRWMRKL